MATTDLDKDAIIKVFKERARNKFGNWRDVATGSKQELVTQHYLSNFIILYNVKFIFLDNVVNQFQ